MHSRLFGGTHKLFGHERMRCKKTRTASPSPPPSFTPSFFTTSSSTPFSRRIVLYKLSSVYPIVIPVAMKDASINLPDLFTATIEEISNGLDSRSFSSVHLTTAYLARIQEVNPRFKAVLEVNAVCLWSAN